MSDDKSSALPLPTARCLNKAQAAEYLGIGVTLLTQIGPHPIKIGRRRVYDRVDLDVWLEEHKARGWAIKEVTWPENEDSISGKIRPTGGSTLSSPMADEYEKALDFGD